MRARAAANPSSVGVARRAESSGPTARPLRKRDALGKLRRPELQEGCGLLSLVLGRFRVILDVLQHRLRGTDFIGEITGMCAFLTLHLSDSSTVARFAAGTCTRPPGRSRGHLAGRWEANVRCPADRVQPICLQKSALLSVLMPAQTTSRQGRRRGRRPHADSASPRCSSCGPGGHSL